MRIWQALWWAAVPLAALASGCAQVEVYEPVSDLAKAQASAGLVVTGEVTQVETLAHHPGKEVYSSVLGKIGVDCIAQEQVSLKVDKVVKGTPERANPLTFMYYGPCFHPEKGVKVAAPTRTFLAGDKLTAYLDGRKGEWWLISHKMETPKGPMVDEDNRIKEYFGNQP